MGYICGLFRLLVGYWLSAGYRLRAYWYRCGSATSIYHHIIISHNITTSHKDVAVLRLYIPNITISPIPSPHLNIATSPHLNITISPFHSFTISPFTHDNRSFFAIYMAFAPF
ncbi:MAG: hypothetical protein IPN94_15875 [Sphingobacteriales bacterium]|nr:hypothetical protein [Sphingobacteriales bacterium]